MSKVVIYGVIVISAILLVALLLIVGPILNKQEYKKERIGFNIITGLFSLILAGIFIFTLLK
ncbi:hypothetical protein [Clostridium magnum]|uniref:Uncharacterized protein n=1 Tax=Clostridium magnum DSM 2767 TaxID=1121326 RepID=A0A161XEW0_9CLOT|nr:hypothetical protein [Clostridium magnum]KZL92986.1 hypothetical protein CLMAG_28000 [Clostridium magnum DSM 2767]SHJ22407.1 hypothetical protein SAMN02745944_05569 [Clostridium magnum DSM 2767]